MVTLTEKTKQQLRDAGMDDLIRAYEVSQSLYGGVSPSGAIVDRREFPEAVPMQKNDMLGIPEAKEISPTPIYPTIKVTEKEKSIKFETILRKNKNGIWYKWLFIKSVEFSPLATNFEYLKRQALDCFHREVYFTNILGIVDLNGLNSSGEQLFEKDSSQISEAERLQKLLL